MRTKCAGKSSVGLWGQSRSSQEKRSGNDGCDRGVTIGIRADPRGYTGMRGSGARACGAWHMWPVVAHGMTHVPDWARIRVPRGNVPDGPTRTSVPLSGGGVCESLA